jgi:hypothetical protein
MLYPQEQEVGWTPELVWMTWRREKSWPYQDSNSNPFVVQPIASRYTDYAIPAGDTVGLIGSFNIKLSYFILVIRYQLMVKIHTIKTQHMTYNGKCKSEKN